MSKTEKKQQETHTSKLNTFYGTGKFYKELEQCARKFKIRLATPDKSARITERNYVSEDNYEFKPINKSTGIQQKQYNTNYRKNNRNFFDSNVYTVPQSNDGSVHVTKQTNEENPPSYDRYAPVSLVSYQQEKRRQYSSQCLSKPIENLSQIVDSKTFRETKQNPMGQSWNIPQEKQQLELSHNYITKPYLRQNGLTDKQHVKYPVQKQVISDDNAKWTQTVNRFYTPQKLRSLKETHQSYMIQKQDIMGNPEDLERKEMKQEKLFSIEPPCNFQPSLRKENAKMVVTDNFYKKIKGMTNEISRANQITFYNIEETKKQEQMYKTTDKIGFTQQPYIKSVIKSQNEQIINEKNFYPNETRLLLQRRIPKETQFKIGHGPKTVLV